MIMRLTHTKPMYRRSLTVNLLAGQSTINNF